MTSARRFWLAVVVVASVLGVQFIATGQPLSKGPTSYLPVVEDKLDDVIKRMQNDKPAIAKRQQELLGERYDLADHSAKGVTMSRGKAVQEGVRVKLTGKTTWDELAKLSAEDIREKGMWPKGFLPLPHPNHAE